jgi:hypothetical protein
MPFVILLPILPCLFVVPLAVLAIGVVMPLWLVSMLLVGTAWVVVVPLEVAVRGLGGRWATPMRRGVERGLFLLTHPSIPERWRKR